MFQNCLAILFQRQFIWIILRLVYKIKFKGKIIGVEIDKDVITIASNYFELNKIQNLEIMIDDSF